MNFVPRVSPLAYQTYRVLRDAGLPMPARLVVGVSGGPDSVALLSLLAELRAMASLTLWGVYVNHGWRPRAAQREQVLVAQIGRRVQVPIIVVRVPARKCPRHSWEGTARDARYAALSRVARRVRAHAVAVGHTQEDQVETLLLALLRGAGVQGLGGMRLVRPLDAASSPPLFLIRPLLAVRHAPLTAYLRERRLPWVMDETNREPRFRRNQLRRTLLPWLTRQFGEQVLDRLATCAELAREDDACLQQQVARWVQRRVHAPSARRLPAGPVEAGRGGQARLRTGSVRLPLPPLRRQPLALQRRILRWAIGQVAGSLTGLTFRHVAALVALAARGVGTVHLPHGLMAEVVAGHVGRRAVQRGHTRWQAGDLVVRYRGA